jgi:thioredoxin-like negative regulator of GroEL
MALIREVVQQALVSGFLSLEAEDQLRQMLAQKYDREDMRAFMTLQSAAMAGNVRQESRLDQPFFLRSSQCN